jgi:HEPN domain-containing protein
MADPEEINEWLDKANEDCRVVEVLLKAREEFTLPSMFHIQQMLEKYLKALILAQGSAFERTHDLARLTNLANAADIENLLEFSETLNLFAVNGRYPGDLPDIEPSEAHRYFRTAKEIRDQLLERIDAVRGI